MATSVVYGQKQKHKIVKKFEISECVHKYPILIFSKEIIIKKKSVNIEIIVKIDKIKKKL